MLTQIHKKVAASVSKVDIPAHYEWMRWLNPAQTRQIRMEQLCTTLYDVDNSNLQFTEEAEVHSKFKIGSFNYRGIEDVEFKKVKSRKVFFKVGKTTVDKRDDFLIEETEIDGAILFDQLEDGFLFRIQKRGKKDKKLQFILDQKEVSFELQQPKTKPVKFEISKVRNRLVEKGIAVPENQLIDYSIESEITGKIEYEIKPTKIIEKKNRIESPKVKDEFIKIPEPEIVDHISELKPKVYKIDLLNFEIDDELSATEDFTADLNYETRVYEIPVLNNGLKKTKTYFIKKLDLSEPTVTRLNNLSFGIPAVRREELIFASAEQKVLLLDEEKAAESVEIRTDLLSRSGNDVYKLKRILLPNAAVANKLNKRSALPLFSFQKKGAKFLLSHKFALLGDELGLGKTMQSIQAMLDLFQKGKIKSTLIIVSEEEIGNVELSDKLDDKVGWLGHLDKYANGLTISALNGFADERKVEWDKFSNIYVTTLNSLMNDLSEDRISSERLSTLDCVIFDEVNRSLDSGEQINELLHTANPNYFWALTSLPLEMVEDRLTAVCGFYIMSMRRTKAEIALDIPKVTRQFQWFEMNEFQRSEYTMAEQKGVHELSDFLDTGNPFRFQANAFFQIHKLKQAANFAADDLICPKDKYLLNQIETIKRSGKKVLVLSQYDAAATKRLAKMFGENKIKYHEFTSTKNINNVDKFIQSFESDRNSTVFLANIKNKLNELKFSNISYVIYYDIWWNPVQRMQMEQELIKRASENITFFGYLTRDTIEERIWLKLAEKDLLNFDDYYEISTDEFNTKLQEEDWLDVLKLERKQLINSA